MQNLKVGLQLYSIRDEMEKSVEAALAQVKKIGYDYVEFAGYFGKTAEEIKALLNKYDLKCISVHQSPELFLNEGQLAVNYLKTIGAKYCTVPWYEVSKLKGTEAWTETKDIFSKVGNLLKNNGIQLLYHNHDFEFNKFEGKFLLDWLYEEIDVIAPEIDTCWVRYAGYNPSEYLEKYSGKISVVHLKDFVGGSTGAAVYELIDGENIKPDRNADDFKFVPLGTGVQDFKLILTASAKAGAEYVIVEQDQSYAAPSLENAKISREYLKSLGL